MLNIRPHTTVLVIQTFVIIIPQCYYYCYYSYV